MEGWELMRIKGIPLRVHPSWFVIFALFAWTTQGHLSNAFESQLSILIRWVLGFVMSLLVFLSVLLHELGHSFVALQQGVKVRSITLFLLGGIAKIERECSTAIGTLKVAIAGPLVSFFLAAGFLSAANYFGESNPVIANLLSQLGSLNLVLGLFNLLPGLPLDGGVIVKAIVWHFSGSYRKGVKVASSIGNVLSLFAIRIFLI